MSRNPKLVYALLISVWGLILAWQAYEHYRVGEAARAALITRSSTITKTLGLVVRSQRRFGGMVAQDRIEPALTELVKSGDLISVALLNASGEIVASAGAPLPDTKTIIQKGERWGVNTVTLVNLLDLGGTPSPQGDQPHPTIVLPKRQPGDTQRVEFPRPERVPATASTNSNSTNDPPSRPAGRPPGSPWGRGRMDEKEYQSLLERRGLHGLLITMPTESVHQATHSDLWTRGIISAFATISMLGMGLAWRNLETSSELQMRLIRASELNSHLKQMNLAAAGLAHETRNPLNIIRGLAQMISKEVETSPEIRGKSREIIDETDRVTAQLNEFINYSRPREVRRAAVPLVAVVEEVVRALRYDTDEKQIGIEVLAEPLAIEADEQMLRQAVFNLVLNAVQAVNLKGQITISARKPSSAEASLQISDNGPGIAPEHQGEIFKPYFTTHQKGTGLGLAVVQQIVLAHGWEIECMANDPVGATFRITHLKIVS
jgi:signal transduction histidine kinase